MVILVLAPFVVVPLGLVVAIRREAGAALPFADALIRWMLPASIFAAAAFVPSSGIPAFLLSVPWCLFTLGVAASGATRLASRREFSDAAIAVDVGLIFLAVGGVWLVLSRAGLKPLGFSDEIVRLTAVHFHYAGFALPIVAGIVTSRLRSSAFVPAAVIAAVPLTALGIVVGGWMEWVSATLMAGAGIATAAALVRCAMAVRGWARIALTAAGVSLCAGMGFALAWAWSIRFNWVLLNLDDMARFHGSLNALGFGLLALIGLRSLPDLVPEPADHREGDGPSVSLHFGRPGAAALDRVATESARRRVVGPVGALTLASTSDAGSVPRGVVVTRRQRRIGPDGFGLTRAAIAGWSGHRYARIAISPAKPPMVAGQTVALAIPLGPLTMTACCRIVDVIDEPDRFGFVYATLTHHPEAGEEAFVVTRNADGTADVTIAAVWKPATLACRVGRPLTRLIQQRVTDRYLDGLAGVPDQLS